MNSNLIIEEMETFQPNLPRVTGGNRRRSSFVDPFRQYLAVERRRVQKDIAVSLAVISCGALTVWILLSLSQFN